MYSPLSKAYTKRAEELEKTMKELKLSDQETTWVKQHTVWLYNKLGKPDNVLAGIKCRIDAMEECVARKLHELPTRETSISSKNRPLRTPTTMDSDTEYPDKPVPIYKPPVDHVTDIEPDKGAQPPRTRSTTRMSSMVYPEPNVPSDDDSEVEMFGRRDGKRTSTSAA